MSFSESLFLGLPCRLPLCCLCLCGFYPSELHLKRQFLLAATSLRRRAKVLGRGMKEKLREEDEEEAEEEWKEEWEPGCQRTG